MIGGPLRPGWLLRYVYDWSDAQEQGTPVKDRPAVIVLTVTRQDGRIMVRVVPVTHRRPDDLSRAVEIPVASKRRLGLDGEKSWNILDHARRDIGDFIDTVSQWRGAVQCVVCDSVKCIPVWYEPQP